MAATGILLTMISFIFLLCIPTGLLCILQYFLSKMESPWPGRVLPIVSGTVTLLTVSVMVLNMTVVGGISRVALTLLVTLLMMSVPTVLFLLVYRTTRRKYREKKAMDKMSIQDLE